MKIKTGLKEEKMMKMKAVLKEEKSMQMKTDLEKEKPQMRYFIELVVNYITYWDSQATKCPLFVVIIYYWLDELSLYCI